MRIFKKSRTVVLASALFGALALVFAASLLAQGMQPAARKPAMKAPAAMKPAAMRPAAMAPAKPGAMAPAGMQPGATAEPKKPLISEADRKLELAKVGDIQITVGDLADRINKMSRYVRGRYQSVDKKRKLLASMIEFEVLAKEAARRGFAKNPDVVRMLRQVMIQRLRQRIVEEKVKLSDINDDNVKAYYEKHKKQYNKPEMVRVSHILLKDEATAKKVATEVKSKGNDPRAFRSLVMKYSTDATTKRRAGDLRYFTQEDKRLPKELVEAAFKLEKRGEIGGPVKSAKGWHVLKLTHRKKALKKTLEDARVKQQIVTRILRERRRQALETFKKDLRTKAKVQVFDDKLAGIKIDTTRRRFGRRGRFPFRRGLGRDGMGRRPFHGMMRRRGGARPGGARRGPIPRRIRPMDQK